MTKEKGKWKEDETCFQEVLNKRISTVIWGHLYAIGVTLGCKKTTCVSIKVVHLKGSISEWRSLQIQGGL